MEVFMKYLGLSWSAVTAVIIYTGLIFGGQAWMLSAKIKPIEVALNNHLSETNQKIDYLRTDMNRKIDDFKKEINKRFDKMNDKINERFDKMNARFDKLYTILLKDKKNSN